MRRRKYCLSTRKGDVIMARKKVTPATEKETTAAAKVAEVKAESVKETVEKVETAKKEETAKKAPAKKTTKETTAKETTAKKTTAKKAEVKSTMFVQFGGKSYAEEELMKIAKDVWTYDLNQKAEDLTNVELYVKPEENKVYYVMNDIAGSFDI